MKLKSTDHSQTPDSWFRSGNPSRYCGLLILAFLCAFTVGCASMADTYLEAQQKNSLSAFKDFLKRFPHGPHTKTVKAKIEELQFDAAKRADSVNGYGNFLFSYPESRFAEEAKKALENAYYQNAVRGKDIPKFKTYLKKYPDGKFTAQAKQGIDNARFGSALKTNTISGYLSFLRNYPKSNHVKSADRNLRTLVEGSSYIELQSALKKHGGTALGDQVKRELDKFLVQEVPGEMNLLIWHGKPAKKVKGLLQVNGLFSTKFDHDGMPFAFQTGGVDTVTPANFSAAFSLPYTLLSKRRLYLIPSQKTDFLTCTKALYRSANQVGMQNLPKPPQSLDFRFSPLTPNVPIYGYLAQGKGVYFILEVRPILTSLHDNIFRIHWKGIYQTWAESRKSPKRTALIRTLSNRGSSTRIASGKSWTTTASFPTTDVVLQGSVRFPTDKWTPFINNFDVKGGGAKFTPTRIFLLPGTKFAMKPKP